MVMAGETGGALPQVLQRLIYVISHEHKVKTEVRSVMQYPILVLACLIAAFILLVVYVVPKFAAVYLRSEIALPWPTRACMFMSDLLRHQAGWLVGGLLLLVLGYVAAMRTERGRYVRDYVLLHTPLIGPLMIKAALSRFSSIFAILQATGVGILDSLTLLTRTIGNTALSRELHNVQAELEAGRGIARPLSNAKYFTPLFINMVAVGEEAGNLDEMLNEVSLHYDAEVEFATRRLTTAMGPILIVCLAAMVGFFALAVYLPMWDLARIVSSNP
jgi:type IV pilus assembly protein PilC